MEMESPSPSPTPQESSLADFAESVDQIQIPSNPEACTICHVYAASVNALQAHPEAATQNPCICCSGAHHFDNCPILANNKYLRGHYIFFCQQLHCEAEHHSSAFQGPQGRLPVNPVSTSPLGFVNSTIFPVEPEPEPPAEDTPTASLDTEANTSSEFHDMYGQYSQDDDAQNSDMEPNFG